MLRRDRHEPVPTADPEAALDALENRDIDLVVMETALPQHDGYRLGQQIRQLKPHVPLIVVSNRGDEEHVVRSLLAFADDYMIKPISPRNLLARVHSLLRRSGMEQANRSSDGTVVVGEISLSLHQMQVTVGHVKVPLTPREISLLSAMMMNPDRVLSRTQLIRLAWGDDFEGCLKTVDVCLQRLRKKIQPHLSGDGYIHAVRGFGYKIQRPARLSAPAQVGRPLTAANSA